MGLPGPTFSFYEQALELVESIREEETLESFQIMHIYREFNADADGTANKNIDGFQPQIHKDGVVIRENWLPTEIPETIG